MMTGIFRVSPSSRLFSSGSGAPIVARHRHRAWIGGVGRRGGRKGVGAALVHWRYGSVVFETAPVTPENRVYYFTEAPAVFFGHAPLQIAATLLFPGALAALVYSLLAAATPRDDLGA